MMDIPGDAVKTYPARGPLRQFRLAQATTFVCYRCGRSKTSKLLTVVDGNASHLICNGCYGRLSSVWDLKAGSLPDFDRDNALLALMGTFVTPTQVQEAQQQLAIRVSHRALTHDSQRVLATVEAVTSTLRGATGLDWSAAIIGLCKAVEMECASRLLAPLKAGCEGLDLALDVSDRDLSRVARYCMGRSPAPELGSLAYTLAVAANSQRRVSTSPILTTLIVICRGWEGGSWIVERGGLATDLETLCKRFRNPSAHIEVMTERAFNECYDFVTGETGLLARIVEATLPKFTLKS